MILLNLILELILSDKILGKDAIYQGKCHAGGLQEDHRHDLSLEKVSRPYHTQGNKGNLVSMSF